MSKPPNTLVDRPIYRDWAVWVAAAVAAAMLKQIVGIYLLKSDIWVVLGNRGAGTALAMELLITAMTATFIGVVLTSIRRALRNWWFRRHLKRHVEFITPVSARNGEAHPSQSRQASLAR